MTPAAVRPAPATLAQWASHLGGRLEGVAGSVVVRGLADDSRAVAPGDLFFARRGSVDDGTRFAADAVRRGAAVVVTDLPLPPGLPALRVPAVGPALLRAADLLHGRPQDDLRLLAVTGTKGKTTVAWLAAAALRGSGHPTALLGTIAHELAPGERLPAANTTPGALEIRRLLAAARDRGCRAAALEVSSHALDQGRVEGLAFAAAAFTNLGHDHLDYHADVEAYFEAKARLFQGLDPSATAVLCADDPRSAALADRTPAHVTTYGSEPTADLCVTEVRLSLAETRFQLVVDGDLAVPVATRLVGRHNALNVAAAVGLARAVGIDVVDAVRGATALVSVPGRLQRVDVPAEAEAQGPEPDDLHAFVDYAHTPEALEAVLAFLAGVGARPLSVVVGCGGDRDRTKRPRMARVAADGADSVVLTSDNPRTEDPDAILAEMEAGLGPEQRERTRVVPDRREAIRHAIHEAPSGATVLVAGKGHETCQILGTRTVPFDDALEVRAALASRRVARRVGRGRPGPAEPA